VTGKWKKNVEDTGHGNGIHTVQTFVSGISVRFSRQ
jgi:hypothetical protein